MVLFVTVAATSLFQVKRSRQLRIAGSCNELTASPEEHGELMAVCNESGEDNDDDDDDDEVFSKHTADVAGVSEGIAVGTEESFASGSPLPTPQPRTAPAVTVMETDFDEAEAAVDDVLASM